MVDQEFQQAQEAYRISIFAGEVTKYVTEPLSFVDGLDQDQRAGFMDFYPTTIIESEGHKPICVDTVLLHHKASKKHSDLLNGGDYSLLLFSRNVDSDNEVNGFVRLRIDSGIGHLKAGSMVATHEKGISRRLLLMREFLIRNPELFGRSEFADKLASYDFLTIEVDNVNERRLREITDQQSPEYAEAKTQQSAWQKLFSREMGYRDDPVFGNSLLIYPDRRQRRTSFPARIHLTTHFNGKRFSLLQNEIVANEVDSQALWDESHDQLTRNLQFLRRTCSDALTLNKKISY